MPRTIRTAVVGLGFGEHHVRTIANLAAVDLVAVADFDESRRSRISSAYRCAAYADAEKMIDEMELDAVSVCVSPAYREPVLRDAAARGVAVFVEKPWATNSEHAAKLAGVCAANPAPVMTGFSFRFHPVVQRALELVPRVLGEVTLGSGAYVFDWLPPADAWLWDPENGGGFFNENSCHLLDVVCALAGRPVEVFAYGICGSNRPSEKAAAVAMRFSSGGTVNVTLGGTGVASQRGYPWLELFATDGYVRLSGETHVWRRLEWASRADGELSQMTASPEQLGRTRYSDALEHFYGCVRDGSAPAATVDDGVLMVRIADALGESFATGRPVGIPEA